MPAQRFPIVISVLLAALSLWSWSVSRCSAQAPDPLHLLIVPFRHSIVDPSPLTGADCCTDVLALGDVNGDGRPDIALGAQESKSEGLVWYENPSWNRHAVARGEFTTDGKIADIDGDGDGDIVIGELKTGLTWYENLGRGADWKPRLVGPGYVHDIEIGDLDGRGPAEIVTCDKKEVAVWRLASSGWTRKALLTSKGEGIALADIDHDSDLDIVFGARWLENTGLAGDRWPVHVVSPAWPSDTRVRAADMNRDGRLDIVLTASEGPGRVSWFEHPAAANGGWREHQISDAELQGTHSLVVADLDRDGDIDVAVAEMHTSSRKRILNFINDDGADHWRSQTLATNGSHNLQGADLDADGDVDLAGKNYAGRGRSLEVWENLTSDNFGSMSPSAAPFLAPGWQYLAIDDRRPDDQQGKMGLVGVDANGDGRLDVAAGSFLYLNPGPNLANPWERVRLGEDLDVYFTTDVDGDRRPDLIGVRKHTLLWLKPGDRTGRVWLERVVGEVPENTRTQGYLTAQIEAGGREELLFTRGTTLSYLRIPDHPESGLWPRITVSTDAEEEGSGVIDIDRDGDLDIVATRKGGRQVIWFENPGGPGGAWTEHPIGAGDEGRWLDRVATADINQDGRLDVIVSEETQDWDYNASIYWFEAPGDSRQSGWKRRTISVLRSANSLDVRDMNGDGLPDVVVAEHTDLRRSNGAPNNLTVIFTNTQRGAAWRAQPIEAGPHSSHLGARVFDLDGDGRPDVVSMGWNQFRSLHLWWRH